MEVQAISCNWPVHPKCFPPFPPFPINHPPVGITRMLCWSTVFCTFCYQISPHFFCWSHWGYLIHRATQPLLSTSNTSELCDHQEFHTQTKFLLLNYYKIAVNQDWFCWLSLCPTHSAFSSFIINFPSSCLFCTVILLLILATSISSNNFERGKMSNPLLDPDKSGSVYFLYSVKISCVIKKGIFMWHNPALTEQNTFCAAFHSPSSPHQSSPHHTK